VRAAGAIPAGPSCSLSWGSRPDLWGCRSAACRGKEVSHFFCFIALVLVIVVAISQAKNLLVNSLWFTFTSHIINH
jgi:hypothetical protein